MARFVTIDQNRANDYQTSELVTFRWKLDDVVALEGLDVVVHRNRMQQGIMNELMRIFRLHEKGFPVKLTVSIPYWMRKHLRRPYKKLHVYCISGYISMSMRGNGPEFEQEDWDLANAGLIITCLQYYARKAAPPSRLNCAGAWRMRRSWENVPVQIYPAVEQAQAARV